MKINYRSGAKRYKVEKPTRKQAIKKYAKRRYHSTVSTLAKNDKTFEHVLLSVVKNIKNELKLIGSLEHNSILRDTNEAVCQFSWETIWLVLNNNVPSLTKFFTKLLLKIGKPLLCFLISVILKYQSPKLCLVQQVIFYGNGSSKEVSLYCLVNK